MADGISNCPIDLTCDDSEDDLSSSGSYSSDDDFSNNRMTYQSGGTMNEEDINSQTEAVDNGFSEEKRITCDDTSTIHSEYSNSTSLSRTSHHPPQEDDVVDLTADDSALKHSNSDEIDEDDEDDAGDSDHATKSSCQDDANNKSQTTPSNDMDKISFEYSSPNHTNQYFHHLKHLQTMQDVNINNFTSSLSSSSSSTPPSNVYVQNNNKNTFKRSASFDSKHSYTNNQKEEAYYSRTAQNVHNDDHIQKNIPDNLCTNVGYVVEEHYVHGDHHMQKNIPRDNSCTNVEYVTEEHYVHDDHHMQKNTPDNNLCTNVEYVTEEHYVHDDHHMQKNIPDNNLCTNVEYTCQTSLGSRHSQSDDINHISSAEGSTNNGNNSSAEINNATDETETDSDIEIKIKHDVIHGSYHNMNFTRRGEDSFTTNVMHQNPEKVVPETPIYNNNLSKEEEEPEHNETNATGDNNDSDDDSIEVIGVVPPDTNAPSRASPYADRNNGNYFQQNIPRMNPVNSENKVNDNLYNEYTYDDSSEGSDSGASPYGYNSDSTFLDDDDEDEECYQENTTRKEKRSDTKIENEKAIPNINPITIELAKKRLAAKRREQQQTMEFMNVKQKNVPFQQQKFKPRPPIRKTKKPNSNIPSPSAHRQHKDDESSTQEAKHSESAKGSSSRPNNNEDTESSDPSGDSTASNPQVPSTPLRPINTSYSYTSAEVPFRSEYIPNKHSFSSPNKTSHSNQPKKRKTPDRVSCQEERAKNIREEQERKQKLKVEQERLFQAAANRTRERLRYEQQMKINTEGQTFIDPMLNVKNLPEGHWRWTNLHSRLGLPENCPPVMIKKQYRKLALLYHPDKGGCSIRFNAIREAYDQLLN